MLKTGPNEPRYKFEEPNPFISEEEEGEVASVAYRYRKWDLGGGIVSIFVIDVIDLLHCAKSTRNLFWNTRVDDIATIFFL